MVFYIRINKLIKAFASEKYDECVSTVHNSRDKIIEKTKPLKTNLQLDQYDNLKLLLEKISKIERTFLIIILQERELSLLPHDEKLLDEFAANPYMFADLQGLWLEGNELRKLVNQGCDNGIKEHITVIDSIDELKSAELLQENEDLQKIKNQWTNEKKCVHAFIINTVSQFLPEQRGHWFTVVIHKVGAHKEIIVLNSLKEEKKDNSTYDYPDIVKTLADYFEE